MKRKEFPTFLGTSAILWQMLFFYLPLAILIVAGFLNFNELGTFEGITLTKVRFFFQPVYYGVIGSSLFLALATAFFTLLVAYPLAYFLSFKAGRLRLFFLALLIVPFWTNFLLHVYAWFFVLDRQGVLNLFLQSLHIVGKPLHMLNTQSAIMVMMVYYYLPFMVLPIYSSLDKFDRQLIEVSSDLGAKWINTFTKVMLPLSLRGVFAGVLLVFVPAFGEFAIPDLMGGNRFMFVGSVVSHYILEEQTGSMGAAFTLVAAFFLLIAMGLLLLLMKKILNRVARNAI